MPPSSDQLGKLPDNTLVYPGHDYIENNLRFTLAREPGNAAAQALLPQVTGHDPAKSAVTTLADEKQINTFMRLDSPGVIAACAKTFPSCPTNPTRRRCSPSCGNCATSGEPPARAPARGGEGTRAWSVTRRCAASSRPHLRALDVRSPDAARGHAAAVAVAVTDAGFGPDLPGLPQHAAWSTQAALIVTRRALSLRRHAGQWALPGGRVEPGETVEQAALREMAEEVGLPVDEGDVLGRLDGYATRSGFVITPVVVWAGSSARRMVPRPDEVQSIHRIPVDELLRPDAPLLDRLEGSAHPVLRMPIGDSWIAAPTAAILFQFSEVCLGGRATRVDHFEQPAFAWK